MIQSHSGRSEGISEIGIQPAIALLSVCRTGVVAGSFSAVPVTFAEHPGDMVYLACTKCERWGSYRKAPVAWMQHPESKFKSAHSLS
jgi:hypothetical protein